VGRYTCSGARAFHFKELAELEAGDLISYNSISVPGLCDEKYLRDPKRWLVRSSILDSQLRSSVCDSGVGPKCTG
jgi:hypothetical protein